MVARTQGVMTMKYMYWLLMVPSIPVVGIALDLHPTLWNALTLVLLPLVVGYLLHTMEALYDHR